jgi:hypothetical protein
MALVTQLSSPPLLLGDFNAHHTLWGCNSANAKGEELRIFWSPPTCVFLTTEPLHTFTLQQVIAVPSIWQLIAQRCT